VVLELSIDLSDRASTFADTAHAPKYMVNTNADTTDESSIEGPSLIGNEIRRSAGVMILRR
jgi:hypothetical protein